MTGASWSYPAARVAGFLFGVPILIAGVVASVNATRAEHWPWVHGVVARAERQGFKKYSHLKLEVNYVVDGQSYVCPRVEFGRSATWRDDYRYYVGATARVFFDPRNPAVSVLEPGVSGAIALELVVGLLLSVLSLYAHGKMKSISVPASSSTSQPHKPTIELARTLALSGDLIAAIKTYREATGGGLKEAKDYIDSFLAKQGLK